MIETRKKFDFAGNFFVELTTFGIKQYSFNSVNIAIKLVPYFKNISKTSRAQELKCFKLTE